MLLQQWLELISEPRLKTWLTSLKPRSGMWVAFSLRMICPESKVCMTRPSKLGRCCWLRSTLQITCRSAGRESQAASDGTLVSELGSLTVEFTRLSQVTGDMRWFDALPRIMDLFDQQQAKTNLPGMWPVIVNARDMVLTEETGFTLGGMPDSLYEYFPKEYALLRSLSPVYRKLYEDSMSAAIRYNFFRPMTPMSDDILVSGNARADCSSVSLDPQGQHLGCFAGGMRALGGRLFDIPEHVEPGRKIADGCVWVCNALPQAAPCTKDHWQALIRQCRATPCSFAASRLCFDSFASAPDLPST